MKTNRKAKEEKTGEVILSFTPATAKSPKSKGIQKLIESGGFAIGGTITSDNVLALIMAKVTLAEMVVNN